MSSFVNGKPIISRLRPPVRLAAISFYLAVKRRLVCFSRAPSALTFFVTSRCNLKCAHCFYWKELNKPENNELSLEEIEKIAASLKRRVSLALTGGEPFLRKDLADICKVFIRHNKAKEIAIATNGYDADEIARQTEMILSTGDIPVSVQVSIDGMEKTHDEIRGARGSFLRAVETVSRLKEIKKKYPATFNVSAAFTVQKKNYNEVEAFIDFMLPFRLPLHFLIVRGENLGLYCLPSNASSHIGPRVSEEADIPPEALRGTFEKIMQKNSASDYKFWSLKQQRIIDLSLRTLDKKTRQIPCYSGLIEGVLYSNADAAFCEFTKPMGNLRDYNYDFYKLWNSKEARKMRTRIKRCFCIHSCALGTSLLLNSPEIADKLIFAQEEYP